MNNTINKGPIWDVVSVALSWAILVVAVAMHPHPHWKGGVLWAPMWAMRSAGMHWPQWLKLSAAATFTSVFTLIIFNPWRERRADYGNAHWATKRETRKLSLLDPRGIILGVAFGQYVRTADPLSMLIIAPPGSGKTAAIIIPTLLSSGNSFIVNDVKGELYAKTADRRREFSRVIRYAPGEEGSPRWNPLDREELPESFADRQITIDRIAAALIETPKGADPMWTNEARALFKFYGLYLVWRDGHTSLPAIRAFALSTGDAQGHIADLLDEAPADMPQVIREEGNGMLAKADKEFAGVFGSFRSALNVFSDPRVAENTSACDFRLAELREACTTVYLCVSNADQTRLAKILGLFFEAATLEFIQREPDDDEMSITFAIDEFPRLGKLEEVRKLPAISRSYRVNIMFVAQSFAQLREIYGNDALDELKNTCTYHVLFSQNELKVAEEYSKAIGNYTRLKESYSENHKKLVGRNRSESYEGVALLLPQQILSMPFGQVLILRQYAFETPVLAQAAFWFKDAAMKPLVGNAEPPPALAPMVTPSRAQEHDPDTTLPAEPEGEGGAVVTEGARAPDQIVTTEAVPEVVTAPVAGTGLDDTTEAAAPPPAEVAEAPEVVSESAHLAAEGDTTAPNSLDALDELLALAQGDAPDDEDDPFG